jgi:CHAT domain-containing protein/tetratricopeptide (TPR) repeat protein
MITLLSALRSKVSPASGAIALLLLQAIAAGQSPAATDWSSLDARVTELYTKGALQEAIEVAQSALRMASTPSESGRSLSRLGFLLYTSGNAVEGEKYIRQSLDVRAAAFGTDSLDYAESANDLALLLRDARRSAEAKPVAALAVEIRSRHLRAGDPLLAESLNTQGSVLATSGEYRAAVVPFERAVAIHESYTDPERGSEEFGTLCINLAGTYQRLGRYRDADLTFEKGLAVLRIRPGPGHPVYAAGLLAHAALKVDLGSYTDAERLYDEGGLRLKATLTERHPLYATFLNNRGFLYHSIGNLAAAEADYRESLSRKREQRASALSVASTLRNLAQLVYARDHTAGEQLLSEAVATYTSLPEPPPFDYTSVLLGLARAERDRGALSEARETVERAIAVARPGLGPKHPRFAAAVRDLGLVYAAGGDDREAEKHLTEALAVAEAAYGPDHPDLTSFLDSLAELHTKTGDYASAQRLYRRSFDLRDRFMAEVLDIGSERFKATSLEAAADPIAVLLAFQAKAGVHVPDARVLAFEVVTRRKGRVLEQVRNWRERLRQSSSESVRRQLAEWQALLECRTSLALALGYHDLKPSVVGGCRLEGTDLAGRFEQLLSDLRILPTDDLGTQAVAAIGILRDRGDAIEASLNRVAGSVAPGPPVSASAISARLAPDEILIEFVAHQEPGPRGSGIRRFGAFVLDGGGRLDWTDVGLASPIDSAVRHLLIAANDWSLSLRNREARAARASEATAQDALSDLSKTVWAPLESLVSSRPSVRRLRIAPDASLNLVPFEAISGGRDLIDRFSIAYLPAGRDLVNGPRALPSSPPLVVVSPGSQLTGKPAPMKAPALRADGLTYLAAARDEASDLQRLLSQATLYSVSDATERRLKDVRGPALLHLAGHGIVVGLDNCDAAACSSAAVERSTDAMALSAIVLEEAYGRGGASSDDGMLTPLELQNVDLRGTEMLVLSQCRMASGVASVGEGVYGMRRAAILAGAQTFVAPLWNVDDRVQRALMAHFYRALARGQSRADALREAKLALRGSPATRSFLYWAPVILSGSASPLPQSLFRPAAATTPRNRAR